MSLVKASPENEIESEQEPLIKSLQDLNIVESWSDGKLKSTTFYHVTQNEEVFFGYTPKSKRETSIAEYNSALQRIKIFIQ